MGSKAATEPRADVARRRGLCRHTKQWAAGKASRAARSSSSTTNGPARSLPIWVHRSAKPEADETFLATTAGGSCRQFAGRERPTWQSMPSRFPSACARPSGRGWQGHARRLQLLLRTIAPAEPTSNFPHLKREPIHVHRLGCPQGCPLFGGPFRSARRFRAEGSGDEAVREAARQQPIALRPRPHRQLHEYLFSSGRREPLRTGDRSHRQPEAGRCRGAWLRRADGAHRAMGRASEHGVPMPRRGRLRHGRAGPRYPLYPQVWDFRCSRAASALSIPKAGGR